MSAILTLERIAAENKLAEELDLPGFWHMKNLIFLETILSVCKTRRIRKDDLSKIGTEIEKNINSRLDSTPNQKQKYKFNKKNKKECNEVIEHLQNNGWSCSFYQLKVKPYRPSLLPMQAKDLITLNVANHLRESFWLGKADKSIDITVMALLEAVASTGISTRCLLGALRDKHIHTTTNGWLEASISEGSDQYIKLPISDKSRLLFKWCIRNNITFNKFKEALSQRQLNYGKSQDICRSFSIAELLTALQNQPFHNGIEGILCSQLQDSLLPVPRAKPYSYLKLDHDKSLPSIALRGEEVLPSKAEDFDSDLELAWHQHYNPDQYNDVSKITTEDITSSPSTTVSYVLPELDSNEKDVESIFPWSQESIITLLQIRFQLRRKLIDSAGTYHNDKLPEDYVKAVTNNAFKLTLDRAYERALLSASKIEIADIEQTKSYLEKSFTGLHLAIDRIHDHLIVKKNTLDTCLAEMSSLFQYGLLRHPASSNLKNWDEEDFEILIHDYLLDRQDRKSLNEETKRNILVSFKSLINYSKKTFSLFPNIELALDTDGFNLRTRRNQVFGPLEFEQLDLNDNPVSLLAFYAGLRSGEIANLTLDDVVTSPSEVVIYIKKGKTPSAKRSIHLHLIAPKKIVESIRSYVDLRQIDYRLYVRDAKKKKEEILLRKQVYLLSNNKDCRTNTAKTVVRDALVNLQAQAGSEADLHLLRHSFASHLFLRWYSCRHPDFITELIDEPHWFFKPEGLANLRIFFGEKPNIPIPDSNITAFTHIIKLFGHKTTHTLFQVYIHSFDAVIQHALKKTHEADNNEELLGKMITKLIPGKRSRKSQVVLESRKIKDLVKLI